MNLKKLSNSQLQQDIWVALKLQQKTKGFFVEAGATDGVSLSNTYMLEKHFGWDGICCEPNPNYFEKLKTNRSCQLDDRVLYNVSGNPITLFADGVLGGTEADIQEEKSRLAKRMNAQQVACTTITLTDLLKEHNAPEDIDYISLDTEGSELKILEAFDFNKYSVAIFSIEHNTAHRADGHAYKDAIIGLMEKHGYSYELNQFDMYCFREDLLPMPNG